MALKPLKVRPEVFEAFRAAKPTGQTYSFFLNELLQHKLALDALEGT